MDSNLVKELGKLDDERVMLNFLKQYLIAKNYQDALICLEFALIVHKNQKRVGGKPYIVHPLAVVIHGIINGLDQEAYLNPEIFIGSGLDHDTIEDYPERIKEFNTLPICSEIKNCVHALDKTPFHKKYPNNKTLADDKYYQGIGQNLVASLIKLEDRYNNFSTMGSAFELKRKIKYLNEFYQRYPKLMQQIENKIDILSSPVQSYLALKQGLFDFARLHEETILHELKHLKEEDRIQLLQELRNSRSRKIA